MPKKVLIIFWGHPLYDGRCVNMINQCISKNYVVKILGVYNKTEKIEYKNATIQLINKNNFKNKLTKYFKYFKYIKKQIANYQPNVIIASDLYSMIPAAQIKNNVSAKIIYDSREIYTQLAGLINKPITQKIWSWYEKKYILKMDTVLVTAEIDKHYLTKLYNHPNMVVMQNLPGDCFMHDVQNNLKALLCLGDEQKIFLYQGKFHNGRGIRFAIKCISKIKNTVLVLIGDGPMKAEYLNTAKKHNLEDRMFFIDAVPYEKLADFSANAYIGLSVIQPISKSYEHALPNKLFEYAVSGLPIICSNLNAMKEMISKHKTGIAIKHNSENDFIQAYETIKNNYENYTLDQKSKLNLLWTTKNKHFIDIINE
tara:strand:- start:397 stop:1503 length:1107 start_codon:yes stop_codon:yes gene_type:complete